MTRSAKRISTRGNKTKRTARFLTLFGFLTLALSVMLLHAMTFREDSETLHALSALTRLPPPALSAQPLEPRIRPYRDYRDHLYPKMQPIDYLEFVYAK